MLRSTSRSSSALQSPTGSENTTRSEPRLSISAISRMFLRMRRLDESANNKPKRTKATVISSGEPVTHSGLDVSPTEEHQQVPVEYVDHYVCEGGVNVATLVRATRQTLLERVDACGANSLTQEQWQCSISPPKNVHHGVGTYKVEVRYHASATRSSVPDPHKPVALDQAKGIPGLMTIRSRNDI
ncbi:hypothetical protein CVT24_011960 [Panaeolus cyanescens]|uniref:Uncharacterized protein n=1 Tax=Panaeolus cyanescens TaxID=181874 RepID=A0A409VIH4_9AGAR|nr:hypothetical protein CVT24_011960 [Panaeolus cyanescens]